jgi:hypothetical protein
MENNMKRQRKASTTSEAHEHRGMLTEHPDYPTARRQLISFLKGQGYRVHPTEVYCPDANHCWVDVAALRSGDYWAFEYKSRGDSIRRGLDQCISYARAFNYVVLVADRNRTTSSPFFGNFRRNGFGVWSHTGTTFYPLLKPQRRPVARESRAVVERQFNWVPDTQEDADRKISEWFPP